MKSQDKTKLDNLLARWKSRARTKFKDAEHETGMARQALEFGATCEANCMRELEAEINQSSEQPIDTQQPV